MFVLSALHDLRESDMYVEANSEASVDVVGSTGTKIAIASMPSGGEVDLINIREERNIKTDGFTL